MHIRILYGFLASYAAGQWLRARSVTNLAPRKPRNQELGARSCHGSASHLPGKPGSLWRQRRDRCLKAGVATPVRAAIVAARAQFAFGGLEAFGRLGEVHDRVVTHDGDLGRAPMLRARRGDGFDVFGHAAQ